MDYAVTYSIGPITYYRVVRLEQLRYYNRGKYGTIWTYHSWQKDIFILILFDFIIKIQTRFWFNNWLTCNYHWKNQLIKYKSFTSSTIFFIRHNLVISSTLRHHFSLFGNMFSEVFPIIYFVLFPPILKLWTVNNSVTICYIYGNRCCTCWRGMTLKFLVLFEYCMEGKITTFTWIVRSFKRSLNPFKYLQLAEVNHHGNLGSNFLVQNISSINRFSGIGNFLLYIGCW